MQLMKIEELIPHKRNSEFFDDMSGEKWQEFLKSIKTSGVIEPIVITQDKVIVSGHQRVRACKELGKDIVMVDVKIYDSEDDVLKEMLLSNLHNGRLKFISNRKKLLYVFTLEKLGLIKDDTQERKAVYEQYKKEIQTIRNRIIEEKKKCDICNMDLISILEVYHLINLSEYGDNDDDNILCLCPNCRTMLYKVTHRIADNEKDDVCCSRIYGWVSNNLSFRSYEKFMDYVNKYIRIKSEMK